MQKNPSHTSLVALGDSFTEGMSDLLPDGSYRGWADLLAARMAAVTPGFRYANLAVRGKLIGQIVAEQVDVAVAMRPDVITLVGGLNDTLRPKCDMGRVRALLTEAVERLAPACEQLVLMRSPGRRGPVLERFRPRMEELFTVVDELAGRHGAVVVDLYGAESLSDPRMWDVDRLHLTAEGHRRVAEAVWQTLGYAPEDADWHTPMAMTPPPGWASRRVADVRFARQHLLPWIVRRLTGRSSGDGLPPKRPELLPYEGPATQAIVVPTRVTNVRGRIHEWGPRLERAPEEVLYVGRRWTMGGWDLPRHPLFNPFAYDTPTRRRDGTRTEVMAMYRAYLLERPDLLELVPDLRGRTLACWCAPELCHANVLAELADSGPG